MGGEIEKERERERREKETAMMRGTISLNGRFSRSILRRKRGEREGERKERERERPMCPAVCMSMMWEESEQRPLAKKAFKISKVCVRV